MDELFYLMLFIHLGALVVAGAANVVMPMLGPRLAVADQTTRGVLGPIAGQLSRNARISLVLLVLTGIAMVALRYGPGLWSNPWFVAKMSFVGLIVLTLASQFVPAARAIPPRVFGLLTRGCLIGIVFCAVMAFN